MLPEQAPWLLDFTAELTTFPNGAHDYQLDAFMDAISCMLYFKASTFNQGMLS